MDSSTREQLNDNMARLADGDREAFDIVYELLWPVIISFARRLMRTPDLADDMAQQALIKIFYHAGTFEAGRDALTWALSHRCQRMSEPLAPPFGKSARPAIR